MLLFLYQHCVQTDPAKNVWTRAYLIPLVIFIHQLFLQYISFHSMWAIQRETERNSELGSSWSSFCGTLSLISQLIYDDTVSWMMLQYDDPVLFQKYLRTNRNQSNRNPQPPLFILWYNMSTIRWLNKTF
jgi:hypothetical protein